MTFIEKLIYKYIDFAVISPIENRCMYFHDFVYQYIKRSSSGILYFIRRKDETIPSHLLIESPTNIMRYLEYELMNKNYNSKYNKNMDCILLTLLKTKYPEYKVENTKSKESETTNPFKSENVEKFTWEISDSTGINKKISELKNKIEFWDV